MNAMKKAPNPTDRHVGSRVRMRRMMIGISLEKLGDALGLTFQQVQKYEKGTNRIGASRLQQISNILKVPVSFFFEGAPGPNQSAGTDLSGDPPITTAFFMLPHASDLAKAFVAIEDTEKRNLLVKIAKAFAK